MNESFFESLLNWNWSQWPSLFASPSFKTFQLSVVIYLGLLWLTIIIWVTRDAISRSHSLLFQVFAILLNIAFPVLGILLYLIVRPGKTVLERYYEELEHRLILDSIDSKKSSSQAEQHPLKIIKRKMGKKSAKNDDSSPDHQPSL